MAIVQFNYNNEFILEYNSLSDVEKFGFSFYEVRQALNKDKLVKGYYFKQIKDTSNVFEYNDRNYLPLDYYEGGIEQLTRGNNHVKFWKNQFLAEKELNLPKGGIQKVLNGEVETTGGYVWKEC